MKWLKSRVSDDSLKRVKQACLDRAVTQQEAVRQAMERWLGREAGPFGYITPHEERILRGVLAYLRQELPRAANDLVMDLLERLALLREAFEHRHG